MGKVFVNMGISLDGFVAGANRGPKNPLGDRGIQIHSWMFQQAAFRRWLKLGDGGETGTDNDRVTHTHDRIGANIMGKRMFEEGERNWPEEAPFHCPVFVLTHEKRDPWVRPGGTTFHFVSDGIKGALEKARKVAGAKDIRVCGGANVVKQALNAGVVDELELSIAPILVGGLGLRLFDGVDKERVSLRPLEAIHSPLVTHVRYAVETKPVESKALGTKPAPGTVP